MTQGARTPHEEGPERAEGAPAYKKERETKEDGRYIIFYTFEDEGEESPDEEASR